MDSDKNNESIVSFAFVCAGALGYALAATILEVLAGTFGVMARIRNIQVVQHGFPVSVGLIVFLVLFLNKKIHAWADECVTEVRKVVWPTRKDTMAMTMVVCATVLFAGMCFGVFDFVASQLIKIFVN